MKKDLHEIEDLLRESRLPDTDFSQSRYAIWHRIINAQRERRKPRAFYFLPSWVWILASILLTGVCILVMYYLASF
ncbi:MAG: hypothetical protein H6696_01070 [Deferribacteres bacterium]|nr:hypothetical protein [candidate division KSB1 bacterium]MCB9500499.1 hypothetical protein [Deferribacteres bacterium]